VKITVQFFSFLRQLTGQSEVTLNLPDGSTVADALAQLHGKFPQLKEVEKTTLIAIGVEFATRSSRLHDGDILSLMPPLQGGSGPLVDELLLTNESISEVEAALDKFGGEVGGRTAAADTTAEINRTGKAGGRGHGSCGSRRCTRRHRGWREGGRRNRKIRGNKREAHGDTVGRGSLQ